MKLNKIIAATTDKVRYTAYSQAIAVENVVKARSLKVDLELYVNLCALSRTLMTAQITE